MTVVLCVQSPLTMLRLLTVDLNNWILAMKREFDYLVENNSFEWQKVPRNKNIVCSRWFFTIKSN